MRKGLAGIAGTRRREKREKRKTPRNVGGTEGRRRNGKRREWKRDKDTHFSLGSEESNGYALVPFRVTKPRRSRRLTNENEAREWKEEYNNGGEWEKGEDEVEDVIEEGRDEEEREEEKGDGEEHGETREQRKTEGGLAMNAIKEGHSRRRKGDELKTRNGEQSASKNKGINGSEGSRYLAAAESSFQTTKTEIHRAEEHLRTRRTDTDYDLDYHDSPEQNTIKRTLTITDDNNMDDPTLKMLNEISHCYDLTYDNGEKEGWWYDARGGATREKIHVAETVVTVLVKDINDNAPVFPNATMFGKVRENGEPGLPVAVVGAWDADDATEGTNARLTYAIEKNVIQEETGEAIFTVEPLTGEVTTALCCLDRETTPEYSIQVVASDGGGLKGTGTVVVVVTDVNDNSPRLARQLWQAEVDETWGLRPPNVSLTLLEVSVSDQDTSNLFFYRIVEGSGLGWDHFGVRAEGGVGKLFARKTLDYENDAHRQQGFRFLVQVTDQGEGGWDDPAHVDSAWVVITLRDLNDNPPQFSRPHAHVTMREDMAPGTLLASFPAFDFDMGGQQPVTYHVEGGRGALTVDGGGRVSLLRQLDREAAGDDGGRGGGASVVAALVVAVDGGLPPAPLSATATLSVTLEDVNDCPPRLLPPTTLRVTEGAPAAMLGTLTATDDDVWALGHGPPFNFSLAPSNPAHVRAAIRLLFDQRIDSGRGGAEVWTMGALDREEHRQLKVGVLLSDAGGLSAVHDLTIIVDDINDNPMRPGAKTVYLWKTQGLGSEAPLGRVYVDDPDDWDGRDKEYAWAGHPHPLFTLQPATGRIVASGQLREGRYDLHFSVSDRKWAQRGVGANVTVLVRFLTPEALAHATPLLLTPVTPMQLTKGWTPMEGHIRGGLGRLSTGVLQALGDQDTARTHAVEVVSVYGRGDSRAPPHMPPTYESSSLAPTTCVWVSVRKESGAYVDPIKLAGVLELHAYELGSSMNLTVRVGDLKPSAEPQDFSARHDSLLTAHDHPSSAASLASTTLPLQVVDTNATALVTPRLTRSLDCRPRPHAHGDGSCTPSCLNGGRCVRQPYGNDRCICPGGSFGSRCKIPARSFKGTGWAWVAPLPPCLPASLSFKVLTTRPRALLLYSGPLATPATSPRSLLAIQLEDGRPRLIYEGRAGKVDLLVNTKVDDGAWHSIYAHFGTKGVVVMVDLCGRGWKDHDTQDDPRSSERNDHGTGDGHEHCLARAHWRNRKDRTRKGEAFPSAPWLGVEPLQVGGMARTPSRPHASGGRLFPRLVTEGLDGCVAHLVVNSQLVDLGEPPYSHASAPGCRPQEEACVGVLGESCGLRGACVGGLRSPRCECDPGWTGDGCSTPTVPALLGASSYMKVALSFTPTPTPEGAGRAVGVQLRVRTRGARDGLLIQLSSHHRRATFSLHLRAGVACASMGGAGWAARAACVEGRPLGDGEWHTVWAERHGHNLVVGVDDGDAGNENASIHSAFLALPDGEEGGGPLPPPPAPLLVDKHDGVTVGGIPEFVGVNLVTVHDDLSDTCVEDIRVSGRPLPLPPAVNGTRWGQVTTLEHLEKGCDPPDPCLRTNCNPPLSCHANWDRATCSCGPGRQLVGRMCEDVDECTWQPCLHGGTCENRHPGYVCTCGPDHVGEQCQWAKLPPPHAAGGHPLTAPAAVVALTVSVLILVVLGVVFTIRLHRRRSSRGWAGEGGGNGEGRLKAVKVEAGDKGRKKKRKKILSQRSSKTSGKGRVKKNQDEAGDKEEEDDDDEEEEEKAAGRERQEACGLTTGLAAAATVKGDAAHQTFLELLRLKVPAAEAGLQKTDTDDGGSLPIPSCLLGMDAGHLQHHLASADDHNHDRGGSSSSSLQTAMLSNEGSDPMKIFGAGAASHFLPGCLGAMDLLRNLPEGVSTTTWPTKCPEHQLRRSTTCPIPLQCPGSHGLPRSHPIDGSTCSTSIARPVESSCTSLRKRPKGDSTLSFYKQSTEGGTYHVVATTDGSTSVNLQVHAIENSPSEIRSLNIQPTGGAITSVPSSVIVSGASSATSITTC